jgi:hypothetical protein
MGVVFSRQAQMANQQKRFYKPPASQNGRDLQRDLDIDEAVIVENYDYNERGAKKRGGAKLLSSVSGTKYPNKIIDVDSDNIAYAYNDGTDTTIGLYNITAKTFTDKKTISSSTADVDFAIFDKYIIAANGDDNIGYFHIEGKFLNFDNQSSNFITGEVITGGTSGATATILAQIDAGTTGTLLLINIDDEFDNNEEITSVSGTADVNGTLYDWYTLANSPKAKYIEIYEAAIDGAPFLFAGNIEDNANRTQWSKAYTDILTLPFTTWSGRNDPANPDDAGEDIKRGGAIEGLLSFNNKILIGGKVPKVLQLVSVPISTQIVQDPRLVSQDKSLTIKKNAIAIQETIFCATDNGLYAIQLSDKETFSKFEITAPLGDNEVNKYNFDDIDIIWDGKDRVYFFFRRSSTKNNYGLIYDIQRKKVNTISGKGGNIASTCRIGNKIYGIDSREMALYELFSVAQDDNGIKINTRILTKEFAPKNDLTSLINIPRIRLRGVIGANEIINFKIITWDENGMLNENAEMLTLNIDNAVPVSTVFGVGITGVGQPEAFPDNNIQRENYLWTDTAVRNISKYQIELISSSFSTHELRYIEVIEEPAYNETYGTKFS